LAHLAEILTHVNQTQAKVAGWRSSVEGLPEFLALTTVGGLWGRGEIALWGRLSIAAGEPIVRPDKPDRRLGRLERIPTTMAPLRQGEDGEWVGGGGLSLIYEDDGTYSVGDDADQWRWVDIHLTNRSCRTALDEARDVLRRFGEHRSLISDEKLKTYVEAHQKLGRPRLYKKLRADGYAVTKRRVANAVENRDSGSARLKGGRPRQG